MSVAVPVPVKISRLADGHVIEIQWDDAGHTGRFDARDLRLACACAGCVEEMSGRPMLDPARVPPGVFAGAIKLVGAYAVHFVWSDGHSTGIYPWERLLASCPCDACNAARGSAASADTRSAATRSAATGSADSRSAATTNQES